MMSIRRELLLTLVSALAIAVCIAALVVYYRVREQTGEVLDYQLRQMALALRDETMQGFGAFKVPPPGFDYAIQIASENGLELRYTRSRIQLPSVSGTGYADIDTAEGTWRLYALRSGGVSIQVAQPMHVRDALAARAAWRTVAPFVLLLPLLALLVWIAVTRGLRPLETVASAVKARSPRSLDPLPDERLPDEIRPVVAALNDLLPRVARALEMQRAFIADAAHELRTPLTAVRLQLQLAERARDEAERAAAFASLRQGLDRTTHLVEQLLTLAREEPGGAARERTDVDLAVLAAEVVSTLSPFAENKSIDLGLARTESGLILHAEREGLRALVSNLVDNALRYTPAGGRVDLSVFRVAQGVVVDVHDTGPGIPADERSRVFDRFYRRAGADLPGSGLGLAIVKSVAERHGATVTLDDAGGGLAVRVVFPDSTAQSSVSAQRGAA